MQHKDNSQSKHNFLAEKAQSTTFGLLVKHNLKPTIVLIHPKKTPQQNSSGLIRPSGTGVCNFNTKGAILSKFLHTKT